ncbi:MAG TPA: nucleoside phosphorylase [Cytophagales bacterium]|nr:nucleoside phosphorylase [Cytophagales bacterium]
MDRIRDSKLLLNRDGSVYHLNLKPEHISDIVITVGDPHRVFKVSQHFNDVDFEMNKREYITHIGKYKGKTVTVISTGMGTDNIEILLMELDLLANFDLKKKQEKTHSEKKRLKIIRLGTSVSLQDIPIGTSIYSKYSIGLDSLMYFYNYMPESFENEISEELQKFLEFPFKPYVTKGSDLLAGQFASDMLEGNSITAPGFYAPQGRQLRLPLKDPKFVNRFTHFHHKNFWFTNFETETAAFYALGKLLGHEMLSINTITENRISNASSKNPDEEMQSLIIKVLDRL